MTPVRSGSGPEAARIMLVGEAFGEEEERHGEPFIGTSGLELNRMLNEAGILRSECYVTNVVNARPAGNNLDSWIAAKVKDRTPDHTEVDGKWVLPIVLAGIASLKREIEMIRPRLIIALGGTPLWALTGLNGILKWRGSLLTYGGPGGPIRLVPTYHPAYVLRVWSDRSDAVHDLRRAAGELERPVPQPPWRFATTPTFPDVVARLECFWRELDAGTELWLDLDLETRAGHIRCCGLSWSRLDAISIPFTRGAGPYWDIEQETDIIWLLYKVLTHPLVRVRWQNGLYDAQYIYRHWLFVPRGVQDTMISQHTLWAGKRKALDYQASLYCDHYVNWKPDKGEWKEGG